MPSARSFRVLLCSTAVAAALATGLLAVPPNLATAARAKSGKAASKHKKRPVVAAPAAAPTAATPPDSLAHPVAVAPKPAVPTDSLPSGKAGELTIIELGDVQRIMAKRAAMILDARSPERFAEGHIPGARNLYVDQFDNFFPELEPLLDKGGQIVVYCDGVDCDMARELGYRLMPLGYTNLLYYKKGWEEWMATKQPREP